MTLALAALSLALLASLVYERVNSRRERDTMLKAVSLAIREGNAEREIHAATVREMATHIQAPEAAPYITNGTPSKQYASGEDDEETWQAIKDQVEGNGRG